MSVTIVSVPSLSTISFLKASCNGDSPAFGGREALVYFRDFRLVASRIVCP